jgi:hypothetical protein
VFSHGYCRWHQFQRPDKPSRIKQGRKIILPKMEFNPMKFKNQIELFEMAWRVCPHFCIVTGRPLDMYFYSGGCVKLSLFLHILSKKQYPQFRLWPYNILLGIPDVHHLFDQGTLDQILKFESETPYFNTNQQSSFYTLFKAESELHDQYEILTKQKLKKRDLMQNYLTNHEGIDPII